MIESASCHNNGDAQDDQGNRYQTPHRVSEPSTQRLQFRIGPDTFLHAVTQLLRNQEDDGKSN